MSFQDIAELATILRKLSKLKPPPLKELGYTATHYAVLHLLASCKNKKTGKCNPSIPYICSQINMGRSSVIDALSDLKRDKWIKSYKRFNQSNRYDLTFQWSAERLINGPESGRSMVRETASNLVLQSNQVVSGSVTLLSLPNLEAEGEATETKQAGLSKSKSPEETRKTEQQPPLTPVPAHGKVPVTWDEMIILDKCYWLSSVRPRPDCFSNTEVQLLQTLLKVKEFDVTRLKALLDFVEDMDDPFWRDRFITAKNGQPLTRPVHFFCISAPTINDQYLFSLLPVPKRTKDPATTFEIDAQEADVDEVDFIPTFAEPAEDNSSISDSDDGDENEMLATKEQAFHGVGDGDDL